MFVFEGTVHLILYF